MGVTIDFLRRHGVSACFRDVDCWQEFVMYVFEESIPIPICIFGIIANIINLVVFYRQGIMSHSCTVCLTGIALSDLLYSCCAGCFGIESVLLRLYYIQHHLNVFSTFRYLFSSTTGCLSVFVSFERLVSVYFPFKVKVIFTPKRSIGVICGLVLISNVMELDNIYKQIPISIQINGMSFPINVYFKILHTIPGAVYNFVQFLPFAMRCLGLISLVAFNAAIAWKVMSSRKFRMSSAPKDTKPVPKPADKDDKKVGGGSSNRETKLVGMIFVISSLYVTFYSLTFLEDLRTIATFSFDNNNQVLKPGSAICLALNASVNIFVYYTMSDGYKQQFRKLFTNRK